MEIKRQIIESNTPPSNKETWWFDINDEIIKRYKQGKWTAILTQESTQGSDENKPTHAIVKYSTTDGSSVVSESAILNSTSEVIFPITNIPSEVFSGNKTLYQVIIADATEIGNYAFRVCSSLTSVTIPDSITSIGMDAFGGCTSLTSVHISDLSAWCKIDFGSFSANPLNCAKNLYLNGELVTELTIPSDITEIKNYAFYYCTSLTSATIGNDVTSIGEEAFYNCTSLTSITIPDSITTIGKAAFHTPKDLTRSVYISNLSTWCKITFSNWSSNPFSSGAKLYLNGSELTDINIPSDITEIKAYAFNKCTSLTSVTIPDSVTSIGERAFQHCSSLTSVTIGNGVTEIKSEAFNGCQSLETIYCKSITPPTLSGEYTIPQVDVIYVPIKSLDAYKNATNWSKYRNQIVGYNF